VQSSKFYCENFNEINAKAINKLDITPTLTLPPWRGREGWGVK
jgi:hypothetical protein